MAVPFNICIFATELLTVSLMKNLFILLLIYLLFACSLGDNSENENPLVLTSRFKTTWNIYERAEQNSDGTITYNSIAWGGLVGSMKVHNLPVDWSAYESLTVEFAEPTRVPTQIMISDMLKTWGKSGITTLTCSFDGQDVRSVGEVAIQTGEVGRVIIKKIYLTPAKYDWLPDSIWGGECLFGDWAGGFTIVAHNFTQAKAGDKLEFIFSTDKSNPDVTYWLFKTIINGTDKTLEGNRTELNRWGCAPVGERSTVYRIVLTEQDVVNLKKKGLFVNGYYNIVTRCNLLRRSLKPEHREQEEV